MNLFEDMECVDPISEMIKKHLGLTVPLPTTPKKSQTLLDESKMTREEMEWSEDRNHHTHTHITLRITSHISHIAGAKLCVRAAERAICFFDCLNKSDLSISLETVSPFKGPTYNTPSRKFVWLTVRDDKKVACSASRMSIGGKINNNLYRNKVKTHFNEYEKVYEERKVSADEIAGFLADLPNQPYPKFKDKVDEENDWGVFTKEMNRNLNKRRFEEMVDMFADVSFSGEKKNRKN